MKTENLTPEVLAKILRYEPETGKLFWLKRSPDMFAPHKRSAERLCAEWNGRNAGKQAFTSTNSEGYVQGKVLGKKQKGHRVAFALYFGRWPTEQIDHINGRRKDNRIINLREVSHQENGRNQKMSIANTSGVVGVSWSKAQKKWVARITIGKKQLHLGSFKEKKKAIAARKKAEADFGFHKNHGKANA